MKRAAPSQALPAARTEALCATKGREFRSSVVLKEPLDLRGQYLAFVPAPAESELPKLRHRRAAARKPAGIQNI
jgi:hypothetical protein